MSDRNLVPMDSPCGGGAAMIDLVVLIDTSDSMRDEAEALTRAAEEAVEGAKILCPALNLRAVWLGIEGTWPEPDDPNPQPTKFCQSHREYLHGLCISDEQITVRDRHINPLWNDPDDPRHRTEGQREDAAPAIIDISRHFDWRPGAKRVIFYLGDEALYGGLPHKTGDAPDSDEKWATDAINIANENNITVHTYRGSWATWPRENPFAEAITKEYARVATETGGRAFVPPVESVGGFRKVLEEIICDGLEECGSAAPLEISPCFEISWRGGNNGWIEAGQNTILSIAVTNPYSNVLFKDIRVIISEVTDAEGNPVPVLPDGTPSVSIEPSNVICFGDLGPCTENPLGSNGSSEISRQVVLMAKMGRSGTYSVKLNYAFSLELTGTNKFELEIGPQAG